ncbi:late secretory pathway protein AVL9 homolog [Denticeps clupeoides]|uniref:late secretory pathway protein AVL9 homolog n=1 Tax=Denticeps clupeoides TaxID=299321 RepID=UPI0010A3C4BD|nr:late secretory pathway protein AVL9 homolog [Denticeps clupeoides]
MKNYFVKMSKNPDDFGYPSSVQNSECGKKIWNAMVTASWSVIQTGKIVGQSVGGALTSAKSAMSSWFYTLAQPAVLPSPSTPEVPLAKE